MPLVELKLRPGINRQITTTLNEGGFSDGDRVRFPYRVPEAIGGWQRAFQGQLIGVCRGIHSWSTLLNERILAFGTHLALFIGKGGQLFEITPADFTPGVVNTTGGTGWGTGGWGVGTWGTARTPSTTVGFFPTSWSVDNWGEELVAAPRGGPLYNWKPSSGLFTKATKISGAPNATNVLLVGMPERHLIALGAADLSGVLDPMLVRWSELEDYTTWVATATNSAGSFRLQDGSQIIGALRAPQQILIWTDTALIGMRFIAGQFIYGFNTLGINCGLCAPHAAGILNGMVFWRSSGAFMMFNGQVQTIPCDVYDEAFLDVNEAQIGKIVCAVNAQFNEVSWLYPSADSLENDRYVTLSLNPRLAEGERWTAGTLSRTAWLDSDVFVNPIGVAPNGFIYDHETGQSDDGQPLNSFVETGYIDISDGDQQMLINQIIPDFEGAQLQMTVRAQRYPNVPARSKGPFILMPTTPYISPRLRGRQIAFRFDCTHVRGFWRGGKNRIRIEQDGTR